MTENHADESAHGSTAAGPNGPASRDADDAAASAGPGGQYVDGDYGEAGSVEVPAENPQGGQYSGGNYADAGVVETLQGDPEGGQYPDGDYGGAGSVGAPAENRDDAGYADREDAEYPDGDYGDAGSAGKGRAAESARERLTDRQVDTAAEEDGRLRGDPDER